MAEAALSKAQELQVKVSVAILDDAGNLKLFMRMDGAHTGSIEISELKASTSAKLPLSSREMAERNLKNENRPYTKFPFVLPLAGGLPIKTSDGEHIGSIGVSGASADQDELCAQAALDAVRDLLKSSS
jgi:glc operon protein GlcG